MRPRMTARERVSALQIQSSTISRSVAYPLQGISDFPSRLQEWRIECRLAEKCVQIPVLAAQTRDEHEKQVCEFGIKLPAFEFRDLVHGGVDRPSFLVRPLVGERVE